MADDDISIVSFERQASTQSVGRLSIDFRRWQSHHEADEDNRKLFSLIEWTKRRRELTRHDQGNDIYIDGVCVLVLKDLLRKTPQPEFDEFDNGRTVLHLAILHRMPVHFILLLVQHMKQAALDCEDNAKCRAIDYLLDWEEDSVSNEILEKLIPKINLSEERDCPMSKNPLIRLCQRPLGGCQLPESLKTSQEFKNKMLEEAVIMGSCSTVKYLLSTGADAESVPYLLHVATTSNHDSLDKIIFLIHHGKLDASQLNEEGQTLVHVAANGKPPMVELLNRALEEGVDPNIRDLYGDTALHKVTKNHGERTISWKESEQAMETLLGHKGLELNVPNSCGLKPLAILMRAKSTLDADLFWKWVQTGADFTDDGYERDLKKRGPQCPLATMCCRPDGHVLIDELLQHLAADKLQDYLKYMLEAAVEKGKAETVRILLDKGANAKEDKGRLLMVAARSKIQVRKKLGYLKNAGADPQYKDSKGFSVLHEVARSDTATEKILKYCTDILQLSTDTKDEYGRMPLHIAAMSNHACSEMLLEKLLDKLPPNATCPHSLFQLVLQNSSNKELRRRKIMLLLEKGYQPTMKDFDDYKGDAEDFQDLFLSTEVFTSSQEPFQFLLFLATYCKGKLESARTKSAKSSCQSDFTKKRQWRKVNANVEAAAIMLIEELAKDRTFIGCELENAYLQDAYKMGWNEVISASVAVL
jgi:ankyrin repeat protein